MADLITTKNKYGVDIVKCCASCKHNIGAASEFTRVCDDGEGIVKPNSLCAHWMMKQNLEKAGKGGGGIKKKHYLEWLLNYKQPENPKLHVSLEDRQIEYEHQFGSRYLIEH